VSSYWLAAAVGAICGMISNSRKHRAELRHSAGIATTASEFGLAYSPTVERPPIALPCLENWHSGKDGHTGELGGLPVSVFDMTERIDTDEGVGFLTKTIVIIPAAGLPAFTSSPRWAGRFAHILGFGGMRFDPAEAPVEAMDTVRKFGRAIRIDLPGDPAPWTKANSETRSAEEAVRRLLTPKLMETLLDHRSWSFQTGDGWLACWRGYKVCQAGERPKWIAAASAIRAVLLAAALDPLPVVVPPAQMPTGGQFLARGLGTLAGVLIGLFGTFFASSIGITEYFRHTAPAAQMTLPFVAMAIGAVVFGVLGFGVGAAIGRIPSIARWTPQPDLTPEQKAKKDRRDSWARRCGCLGFFVGGAAGIGGLIALALLIWPNNEASALRIGLFPIVPISAAIAGLIGGAMLGSWVARRKADGVPVPRTPAPASGDVE
jgi:hypothetical protein